MTLAEANQHANLQLDPPSRFCTRMMDQVISRVSMSASYLVTMSTVHVGCDKQTDMTMEKTLLN